MKGELMDTEKITAAGGVSGGTNAPQQNDTDPTINEKTADRPHTLTVLLSAGALILSIVGIVISGFSVYYTRLALRVGQRAYLSFTPTFPTYNDDPSKSEDDLIALPASIEIKNLGNTPAYDVRTEITPRRSDSEYQFWLSQPTIPAIGPKDATNVQFNIAALRKIYKNGRTPGSAPQLCATVKYTDVFGSEQSDRSCFGPAFNITMERYNPPRKLTSPSP
jgi:hypothetical protein